MLQSACAVGWQQPQMQGKYQHQHEPQPESRYGGKHQRHNHARMVQHGILSHRRDNPKQYSDKSGKGHGKYGQKQCVREPGDNILYDRLPALVGYSQIKMEYDIPDVVKKADQKRLVIPEFRVQSRDILFRRRDSEDNGTGISRRHR